MTGFHTFENSSVDKLGWYEARSALEELQLRLGPDRSPLVRWIVDDLTDPGLTSSILSTRIDAKR
jgi:hypothetical protein